MPTGELRSSVRTDVVWAAVQQRLERPGAYSGQRARIVDIGGGTGGFAVRLASLGHVVTVVDPSPDALAALDRRAAESDLSDLVTGVQGDLADLAEHVGDEVVDVVLCHGVLEVAPDPDAALRAIAEVLHPGGLVSLLAAQRHAAVVARAMAGHFHQALDLLDQRGPLGRSGRRFTADELTGLVVGAGFGVDEVQAIRVFTDLVPGSLLDLEPGASTALVELEQAVASRPEYLPLATQVHLLAHR
ncbi:MAG TPA: methyltransferase domain-containing protein [Nocardioides sp.]|jgi:ubiquinone/menaquinone biosynthesis C-methylase UbiE|nr:methyltransferase domain-containing protein [Nocardioides sp.]